VFTTITNSPIVKVGAGSFGHSWADMDNDGRIDLFIARNGAQGLLFRQQADGTFTKITLPLSQSFGAAWADYDNDGFVDLLVADEGQSILWHNDGQGGLVALRNTPIDALGDAIAWADYDKDGDLDVFIV